MAELTYSAVGATRGVAPEGFRAIDRSALIGHGDERFRSAVDRTMRWGLQRGSGMRVFAADRAVREGDEARLRIPLWPRAIPCRVVYVVDEPDAAGFAYGTLRGHPESGEEAFLVERRPDGSVWTRIVAFSRPAGPLIWLGYPIARLLQEIYTRRYLRALRG
ncbi:MAG TPA: DUF1990 domain-containing protein [Candidatus Microbacterium stercoravium]|uniref:DUF1990 domain-containing protein n=1 Tax=Candidatus Microbacterium stercoravium TaxID=2838697 RepID=A0A9D2H7Q5_9MICO|nr:DUF1990 domain-containing protein [Candidatus Microbacterium stercoravium]